MSGHTVKAHTARGFEVRIHADPSTDGEVFLHMTTDLCSMHFSLAAEDVRAFAHALTMATDESLMQREVEA